MNFDKKIRQEIVQQIDDLYEKMAYHSFIAFGNGKDEPTQEECDEIESIFMSYRNVVAGTEWDGEKREYEKYKVK